MFLLTSCLLLTQLMETKNDLSAAHLSEDKLRGEMQGTSQQSEAKIHELQLTVQVLQETKVSSDGSTPANSSSRDAVRGAGIWLVKLLSLSCPLAS
jgi:hypothetical protein